MKRGVVIFVDSKKIFVRSELKLIELNTNEHTKGLRYQDEIEFDGSFAESKFGKKTKILCEPNKVLKINSSSVNKTNKKEAAKTTKEDQSKFLISASDCEKYIKGSVIEKFGKTIEINHVGKTFSFKENTKPGKKKTRFSDGEDVCYVYYKDKELSFSGEDFFKATKDYYAFISYIKKHGIKPRHKPSEVAEIKKARAFCDSRLKIEGNSWIALNDEYLWYITHKLSPISMDNNVKINNQFSQCWRIALHQISNKISELEKIDMILFKSNAIPNAEEDEEEEID